MKDFQEDPFSLANYFMPLGCHATSVPAATNTPQHSTADVPFQPEVNEIFNVFIHPDLPPDGSIYKTRPPIYRLS